MGLAELKLNSFFFILIRKCTMYKIYLNAYARFCDLHKLMNTGILL